ncbi:MAG: N-acetyltransferase [Crocinitomicaceae bacterium]|nr:N-acetyltransferase [Flavobacteriales bacterium]NQZ37293.1 N-acetyltransferase [Crocinitomicaceae bacterium]
MKNNHIHPLSDVQSSSIGEGTAIWQFCVILAGAKIGDNCNICSHVFIENEVTVGNDVTIKNGVQLWDGVVISDRVFIGPNVTFTNDLYPRSKQYPEKFGSIEIHEGASIGANSTLIAGIEIGKHALIGAGSLVNKNIPNHSVWVGNPCRQIGYISNSGKRYSMAEAEALSNFDQLLNQ